MLFSVYPENSEIIVCGTIMPLFECHYLNDFFHPPWFCLMLFFRWRVSALWGNINIVLSGIMGIKWWLHPMKSILYGHANYHLSEGNVW